MSNLSLAEYLTEEKRLEEGAKSDVKKFYVAFAEDAILTAFFANFGKSGKQTVFFNGPKSRGAEA
jgi:hypothetical protein